MPIKGRYPLTSQISGSDLDGDNFFICWDDRLIPEEMHPPNIIDQPVSNVKK
jgi:RNA-dependent RNA polymerase